MRFIFKIKLLGIFFVVFGFAQEAGAGVGVRAGDEINPQTSKPLTEEEYNNMLVALEINDTLRIRKNMLLAHEILGWTTVGLLSLNTFFLTPEVGVDVHKAVGIAGGTTYLTTAAIAIFTPTLHDDLFILGGDRDTNRKFVHKLLAFIHFPAMVTTVVLGLLIEQRNEGKLDINYKTYKNMKSAHTVTSYLTLSALTASLVVVYFDF